LAAGIIATCSIGAYAVGWSPIPFSDAPILTGIQTFMVLSIASVFGVAKCLVAPSLLIQAGAGGIGLGAASALKLIPGFGTLIGGLIDSTIAGAITLSLGVAYMAIFSYIFREIASATAEERESKIASLLAKLDVAVIYSRVLARFSLQEWIKKRLQSKEELESTMIDFANDSTLISQNNSKSP